MFNKIKEVILANLVPSIAISVVVVVGIGGFSYLVLQQSNRLDSVNDSKFDSSIKSCASQIKIGTISVEKDPAGDSEAWLRFDYTSSAKQSINCKYAITFYDNQQQSIRTISDVEDAFQPMSGQIYNGYSSTAYQAGMTARVSVQ